MNLTKPKIQDPIVNNAPNQTAADVIEVVIGRADLFLGQCE